jgi:hypothetical protein
MAYLETTGSLELVERLLQVYIDTRPGFPLASGTNTATAGGDVGLFGDEIENGGDW